MLYNFSNIQRKIFEYFKQSSVKLDKQEISKIFSYLSANSLVKNGHIDHIYFETSIKPFLLDKEQVAEITEKLENDCNIFLPLETLAISEYAINSENVTKFNVKSVEDYEMVLNLFLENSKYGEMLKKEKDKKEERKEATLKNIMKKKEQRREQFNKISSLDRNFAEKRVLSIDLEFFLNRKEKTHRISEIGIAYKSPNSKKNVHFLIEEYYKLKINNKGQNKFDFGNTEILNLNNAKKYLTTALEHVDFILFHEAREDLAALKEIGVDIINDFPNVTIIDTQEMYKRYFAASLFSDTENYAAGKNLSVLTDLFKVTTGESNFHNAGNDAEYTLQLLFAMKNELWKRKDVNLQKEKDPVTEAVKIIMEEAKKTGKTIEDLVVEKLKELNQSKIKNEDHADENKNVKKIRPHY